MSDKQRRPRQTSLAADPARRGPVRPPMDNGVFALLQRRGNQAANEALAARQGSGDLGAPQARGLSATWGATAELDEVDLAELRAELVDMAAHGSFSFLQLVAVIDSQPDLSDDQGMQLKEELRQLLQQQR